MTSQLVNYLVPGQAANISARRETETFIANGTIAAGDWVALDSTKTGADRALYVIEAAAVALGNPLVIGVALSAAVAGDLVRVVTAGYVEGASVAAGLAAGSCLVVDTTAGMGHAIAAADTTPACGVSLEAEAAGVADCIVYKNF